MEISNEIKSKVFAPYTGFAKISVLDDNDHNKRFASVLNYQDLSDIVLGSNNMKGAKLILKPLIDITDEHAIEMAKLFGQVEGQILINRPTDLSNKDIHFVVQVYTNLPKWTTYSVEKEWSNSFGVHAYQYLQSKGYDLPHYLLGGKTLQEVGLAIYKN